MRKIVLSLIVRIFFQNFCLAQDPITLSDSSSIISIGDQIDLYTDQTGNLTVEQVATSEYSNQFKQSHEDVPNIGATNAAIWCRFVIKSNSTDNYFLKIGNPYLDTIQLFVRHGNTYKETRTGKNFSFLQREIKSANFILSMNLQKDLVNKVYLRIKHHLVFIPLQIGKLQPLLEIENRNNLFFGVYFGIIIIILLYNFLNFLSFRDPELLYYVLWVAFAGIYGALQKGYLIQLIPDASVWLMQFTPISIYFATIFNFLFSLKFLKAKSYSKLFYIIYIILIIIVAAAIVLFLSGFPVVSAMVLAVLTISSFTIYIVFSSIIFRRGYKPARFFLIAFSISLVLYCIYVFQVTGLVPVTFVSQNSIQFGSMWEMILLSFAIIDKINVLRHEKYIAQKEKAAVALENEKLIRHQNILLEQKVEERTHQLETEKMKSDNLLLNILPTEVAEELKEKGSAKAKQFDNVSVLFTDFVGFTLISEKLTPAELVEEIHLCFTGFDQIIERNGLEKIKTIGDAYLAVCGMPMEDKDHARKAVQAAIEIMAFIKQREIEGGHFEIRSGINSGIVVAGIVGVKKFAYDIWGDTVNTAARMEQNSDKGKLNISGSTYELVKNYFICKHRGKIEAKNKGEVDMYFVEDKL